MNINFRLILKLVLLALVLIFLSSCARIDKPVDNDMFLSYIVRANNFLKFCIFLIKSEELYMSHIVSRLYYSYFSLARIVHIGKTKKFNIEKHDVIWQINKKDVRKLYGDELKRIRNYVDYSPFPTDAIEENLRSSIQRYFFADNDLPFYSLLNDAKEQTKKFYKFDSEKWIEESGQLFDNIEQNHRELKKCILETLKISSLNDNPSR